MTSQEDTCNFSPLDSRYHDLIMQRNMRVDATLNTICARSIIQIAQDRTGIQNVYQYLFLF